ncbi:MULTISPECIES: permease-like cell division protein FtsX [Corynebacterium]|uniref:Cell division protein FtsX n=1 Tax=Corynebacterium pseudogenitalium TaxID=38303 RepID=A0ABD4TS94_9CORY|nr:MULTISPECIES: permease-like cell division protein FtsX [Corynebacterium]MCQ4609987.1 permease-like cell division protein FtsX [Corynebacterium sp. CCUG 61414]MCQ4614520.1 permease-like cell division protein FtsX [Corynebacterium pseudogenitalium]MCQ4616874.1 permease-like cell division protein FtsX [Corynebacterium pseudogenitalium]MDK8364611.1 permease-like cell division protein FtsX [Corynebacterium sp. UMB10119B]UUA87894.1 permease-like cell division protein FtsX [Corynebacterium pseudog
MNWNFIFREGLRGLGRNFTMTIALIITTALSLVLVGAGILISQATSATKDLYLDRVEVMVELDETISAEDNDCSSEACREVRDTLQADDRVEQVTFRSREQSYERFVELFQDSEPDLVRETSPDALPAALHVRLKDPSDIAPIDAIRDMPQVAMVSDQADTVREAAGTMDTFRNVTFVVAAAQALASLFLIVNMVQLAAYNRREQIAIMRMVGASRWFTQAPFVLEAVLSVLIGAVLATVLAWVGKRSLVDPILGDLYASQLVARVPDSAVMTVMPLVGLGAVVIGALAAQVALRSYVRK